MGKPDFSFSSTDKNFTDLLSLRWTFFLPLPPVFWEGKQTPPQFQHPVVPCRLKSWCPYSVGTDSVIGEEPAGSPDLILMVALPVCPCLCPEVLQEVFIWTSFLFDSRSNGCCYFLLRKSCNSSNDQNGVTLAWMRSAQIVAPSR